MPTWKSKVAVGLMCGIIVLILVLLGKAMPIVIATIPIIIFSGLFAYLCVHLLRYRSRGAYLFFSSVLSYFAFSGLLITAAMFLNDAPQLKKDRVELIFITILAIIAALLLMFDRKAYPKRA